MAASTYSPYILQTPPRVTDVVSAAVGDNRAKPVLNVCDHQVTLIGPEKLDIITRAGQTLKLDAKLWQAIDNHQLQFVTISGSDEEQCYVLELSLGQGSAKPKGETLGLKAFSGFTAGSIATAIFFKLFKVKKNVETAGEIARWIWDHGMGVVRNVPVQIYNKVAPRPTAGMMMRLPKDFPDAGENALSEVGANQAKEKRRKKK